MGRRTGQESGKGVSPALGAGGGGERARNGHWPGEGRVVEGRAVPTAGTPPAPVRSARLGTCLQRAASWLCAASSGVSLRFGACDNPVP